MEEVLDDSLSFLNPVPAEWGHGAHAPGGWCKDQTGQGAGVVLGGWGGGVLRQRAWGGWVRSVFKQRVCKLPLEEKEYWGKELLS